MLVLHDRAVGSIQRIGKPDATVRINHYIIGAVVSLAFIPLRQHFDFSGLHICPNDAPPAAGTVFAPLAANQPPLPIKRIAVGPPAVLAKRRHHSLSVHFEDPTALNIAKEDVALGIDSRAFEKTSASCDRNCGFWGQQFRGEWSFGKIRHLCSSKGGDR